jgi:tether containing UBX domain for GLUT4
MSLSTEQLLTTIAKENRMTAEAVAPFISKLNDEWYNTADSLMDLTDTALAGFGLPKRLVELIKGKLSQLKAQQTEEVGTLSKLVYDILGQPQGEQDLKECIRLLQVIILNILKANPIDDRVRRLKLSNQKFFNCVGRFQTALDYLCRVSTTQIGFQQDGDLYYLPSVDPSLLTSVLHDLNEAAENIGLETREVPVVIVQEEVKFDPYKASVTSVNPDVPRTAQAKAYCPTTITEEMRSMEESRDVRPRQQEVAQLQVDRNPKVFVISEEGSVRSALQAIQDEEMERLIKTLQRESSRDYGSTEEGDYNAQLSSMKAILDENEKRSRFQNKRKQQLDQMKKNKTFTHAIIRVRFPDRLLLQGSFLVLETVNDLYAFVAEALVQTRKFELFLAPPRQVIKPSKLNLKSMAPATIVNFAWADLQETRPMDGPFLKPELVAACQSLS